MAPRVICSQLCSPACKTPAIQPQLNSCKRRMPAVASHPYIANIRVEPLTVGVIGARRFDSTCGKTRRNAARVEQSSTTNTVDIVVGIESVAARPKVGCPDDKIP